MLPGPMPKAPNNGLILAVPGIEHPLGAFDEHPEIRAGHAPEHFQVARGFDDANAFVVEVRDGSIQPHNRAGFHSPPQRLDPDLNGAPIAPVRSTYVTKLGIDTPANDRGWHPLGEGVGG